MAGKGIQMDKATAEILAGMREELFSLARAHRNVVPSPDIMAVILTDMAVRLAKLTDGQSDNSEAQAPDTVLDPLLPLLRESGEG